MDERETRPAYDLKSWLYHQNGARLYRLCARTRADCVYMADGVDAETRINTIERALAANTTTRLVKSLAERDGLTGLVPGDRVYVGEGEEAGCYAWIPPGGWALLWSGQSPVDLAEAVRAGGGIGCDAARRLYVEWDKAPLSEWAGGGALRVTGGVMVVAATDALDLDDSGVCATAKAAKILNEKAEEAAAAATAALDLAGEGKVLAASAEIDAREARGDAAAAAIAAGEAGTRAEAALEAATEALTEGAKTAALLAAAEAELSEAREELADIRAGVEDLAWVAENRENIEKLADLVIPPDLSERVAEIAADQVNLNERLFERGCEIERLGADLAEAEGALEALGADVSQIKEEAAARLGAVEETLADLGEVLAEKVGREDVFLGATEEANGPAGLVPGALSWERNRFLRGDGEWAEVPDRGDEIAALETATGNLSARMDAAATDISEIMAVADDALAAANQAASAAVTLSGEQTITGLKKILATEKLTLRQSANIAVNVAPASQTRIYDEYLDKNGAAIGRVGYQFNPSRTRGHFVSVTGPDGNPYDWTFQVNWDSVPALFAPANPPDSENTLVYAPTMWVRARIAAAAGKGATTFAIAAPAATFAAADGPGCVWEAGAVTPYMREAARDAIKAVTSARIFAGFYFEVEGEFYFFTYDLYDQQNMADNALIALAEAERVVVFARDEEGRLRELKLEPETALALHRYAVARKKDLMREGLALRDEADAITAYPAFEFWLEDKNLLEAYYERLECLERACEGAG